MKTIITSLLLSFAVGAVICRCGGTEDFPQNKLAVVGMQGGDTVTVAVDSIFSAAFMVGNARNVYAFSALVNYDTTYLGVVTMPDGAIAGKGTFLGSTGDLTAGFVNGTSGNILFAYSKQGDQPGSSGDGDLWTLSMQARKAGLTKIAFDRERCFVMSPNVVGMSLEILPSRFDDKLVMINQVETPGDTAVIYIRIN